MAAPIQKLAQFNLAETDDGYLLEIGGDKGGLLTVEATPEQLDAIVEALDALLSADDDAVEGDDDDGVEDGGDDDEIED